MITDTLYRKYNIRQDVIETLERYVVHRIPTGGFLHAVLTNNLMEAMHRADPENKAALAEICEFVYWELPSICWGSKKIVDDWLYNKPKEN